MTGMYRQYVNFAFTAQLVQRSIAYAVAGTGYAPIGPRQTTSEAALTDPILSATAVYAPASTPASLVASIIALNSLLPSTAPSSTASASLIRITALPPATSAGRQVHHPAKPVTPFNIAYLAPLFAVLGAAAGAIVAWCVWRWLNKRAKRWPRTSGFLDPGPRYVPPPETGSDKRPLSQDSSKRPSLSDGASRTSWLQRALSRPSAKPAEQTRAISPRYTAVGNDDGPLVGRPPITRGATSVYSSNSGHEASDVGGEESYDGQRQNSIRRRIFELLRVGSVRHPLPSLDKKRSDTEAAAPENADRSPAVPRGNRIAHVRRDSDFTLDAIQLPPMAHSPTRPGSVVRDGDDDALSTRTAPGFRIFEEDVEADRIAPWKSAQSSSRSSWQQSGVESAPSWSTPRSSPTKYAGPDRFTALPARRTAEEKRISPFSTPTASRTTTLAASTSRLQSSKSTLQSSPAKFPPVSPADSYLLSGSPVYFSSPSIEPQLFSKAIGAAFGSTPSLNLSMPGESRASMSPSPQRPDGSRTRNGSFPMPYPSTASNPSYRDRLKMLASRRAPAPQNATPLRYTIPSPPASPSPNRSRPSGPRPTEHLISRNSALAKVEAIVSRGWVQRGLNSGSSAASPTRSGAVGHGEADIASTSIPQRLASLVL